ncbi:MAG: TonB family protein [Nitrospinota bacterium]
MSLRTAITISLIGHALLFVTAAYFQFSKSPSITPGYHVVDIVSLDQPVAEIKEEVAKEVEKVQEVAPVTKALQFSPKKVAKDKKLKPQELKTPKKIKVAKKKTPIKTIGDEVRYQYYIDLMVNDIYDNWETIGVDVSTKTRDPIARFDILKDGSIINIELVTSSGSKTLDDSVLKAIRKVVLPPLPKVYKEFLLPIRYTFEYDQVIN